MPYWFLTSAQSVVPAMPQEDWGFVFSTVVTGLVVVFLVLLLLICLLVLTGRISVRTVKSNRPRSIKPVQVTPKAAQTVNTADAPKPFGVPVQSGAPLSAGDDLEVIAVIAAAIGAYSAANGKKARIVDIQKRETGNNPRSLWGMAGVAESMRPFN